MQLRHLHIVYPPQADLSIIPYRVASLAERLHRSGHSVSLYDDNLQAYTYFLEGEGVVRLMGKAQDLLENLERLDRLGEEQEYQYYRLARALLYAPYSSSRLDWAWQCCYDERSTLPERLRARRVLQQALELASIPFLPTCINLHDLQARFSTQSLSAILLAASHTRENPYFAFWRQRLEALRTDRPDALIIWLEVDQQFIPAFTLAYLVKQEHLTTPVILAGPLVQPFAEVWADDDSWKTWIDAIAVGNDPLAAPVLEGLSLFTAEVQKSNVYSLARLPLSRYPIRPFTVSLPLDEAEALPGEIEQTEEKVEGLYRRMHQLAEEIPDINLHIATPLQLSCLTEVAQRMRAASFTRPWGSCVAFGTYIAPETALALAASGCQYLHFELKGYLGYQDEATAERLMLETWRNTRASGMNVLWTVTYGHPLDDLTRFVKFTTFLKEHADAADRLVRFKVFRLYRGSRFWRDPQAYQIQLIKETASPRELQRHFDFITDSGVTGRQLQHRAASYIAILQGRLQDLPNPPLAQDDWAFAPIVTRLDAGSRYVGPSPTSDLLGSEGGQLVVSPTLVTHRFAYPFARLAQKWSSYVAGHSDLPSGEALPRASSAVAYEAEQDRLLVITDATLNVLARCRVPVQRAALLAHYPEKQHPAIQQLLQKFLEERLIEIQ